MQDEKKIQEKHTPNSAKNAEGKASAFLKSLGFYRPHAHLVGEKSGNQSTKLADSRMTTWRKICVGLAGA